MSAFKLERRPEPILEEMLSVADGASEPRPVEAPAASVASAPLVDRMDELIAAVEQVTPEPAPLADRLAALAAEFGVEALHRAMAELSPPLMVAKVPDDPEAREAIKKALRDWQGGDMIVFPESPEVAFAHTHPILPGCTFPMGVEAVEVFAFLRDPLACEGALAHAARGRATAIYTEPPVANSEAGPRELVAVLMPASGYKAQD